MKNSNLLSIKEKLNAPPNLTHLAQAAAQVLAEQFPQTPLVVVQYQLSPQPLSVLFSQKITLKIPAAFSSLAPIYHQLKGDDFTQQFVPGKSAYEPGFIVIAPQKDLEKPAFKALIEDWRALHLILREHAQHLLAEQNLEYGNQISQLIHDIDALMRLWEDPTQEPQRIEKRLVYQKKLNQRLLFFVRDLEILKTKVNLKQLLDAVLEDSRLAKLRGQLKFHNISPETTIEVDLELFNMAVQEALQNALKASQNDLSKIEVHISKSTDDLHFFLNHWLIVTIINTGPGINPDFLPWVKTPYFTTWKDDGNTGFGLAICQKILAAHQGYLDVRSATDGKTEVSLYWPMKHHD